MSEITDEMLMAHVDGTLPQADCARVDAELAVDPALRRRRSAFEITSPKVLGEIYSPISHSPVPERLLRAVAGPSASAQQRGAVETLASRMIEAVLGMFPRGTSPIAAFAALAACLAGIGYSSLLISSSAPASDPFQTVLETARSGSAIRFADSRGARVLTPRLTFEDKSGRFCRRYLLDRQGTSSLAGIACRDRAGYWRIDFEVETGPAGKYTSAGGGGEALEERIGAMINSEVFGTSDENRLLKSGWLRSPAREKK